MNGMNEISDKSEMSLINVLKSQKAIQVPVDKKVYNAKKLMFPSEIHSTHIMIPPNRAIITFNRDVKKFKTVEKKYKAPSTPLPEYWANFDPNSSKYSTYITKPQNQQKCGSCFAFAAATAISDVFIFGKKLNYNPNISPLSILSCIKDSRYNLQCNGGDTLSVINAISRQGITTNYCMNYDKFCNNSKGCYTAKKKPFDEKLNMVFELSTEDNNIPECGCCPQCDNNYSYYITEPELISKVQARNVPASSDAEERIKDHIFNNGAAVTGYVVYYNFVKDQSNGRFEKTRGIYIETERYSSDNEDPKKFMGCHAVVIVGWGIEKSPITLDDGTVLENTPYWIVRNSWGTEWGNNGYFKIAMNRIVKGKSINDTTAFEKINTVTISVNEESNTYQMGGTILFKSLDVRKYDNNNPNCTDKDSCNETSPGSPGSPLSPLSTSSPVSPSSPSSSSFFSSFLSNLSNKEYIEILIKILVLCLVIAILIYGYKKL